MKKVLISIIAYFLLTFSVLANIFTVYLNPVGYYSANLSKLSSIAIINLAYAQINSDFSVSSTNKMLQFNSANKPTDLSLSSIGLAYREWTTFKNNNRLKKIVVTVNGDWSLLTNEENARRFTLKLLNIANEKYPVYFNMGSFYEERGYVDIDGIDLDFRMSGRPSEAQQRYLARVINEFKRTLPNKIISLTINATAADLYVCQQANRSPEEKCSNKNGSPNAGEMYIFLNRYLKISDLSFVNLMVKDNNVNYEIALANMGQYIPKDKLILNIAIRNGDKLKSVVDMEEKIKNIKNLGYGGISVYGIDMSKQDHIDIINYLFNLSSDVVQ
ncbi:MAG: hypothetical protein LBH40_02000 [Alphaproteobacteria bacterium]|nr:hypothetical protein [Alphaproteobacteria bacterium]